ncbi:hypothetical protein CEN50_10650 [Fischerella thermalis CCMEE 5268]|uniref:TIGR02710 family CRISPR-associated protein n=1 Tax=Fischerella thermalis CCMEE 5268 TaxID=2019662 RepID=A0A2N6KGX6_9CYAN|nr:hypothetical protein [Fischerella thermalis]PLZ98610.1 hypothetical protein CEN50_10650 [Fischerella thermalis CCMEE 5268]PMB45033.1 hypothetical protein CEN40_13015 [Fischerella thermalis CCMEE 5205]
MSKILLVTVGGSFQPIITAIRSLQPDRVIFIASDGEKGSKSQVIAEGTPCEVRRGAEVIERLPNIPTQVDLGENFQPERDLILVQNPDNLAECYPKIYHCIRNLQQESGHQIMADYTGGTKTLSAALVMAAVDCGISLYITIAARDNLVKVERGELTQKVDTSFK